MPRETTEEGIERGKRNALAAWALIVSVGIAVLTSVLDGDFLWAGFGLVALGVVLIPAGTYRRATAMVPWESLLLVAIPILSVPFGPILPRSVAVFLAVAALALVVSVELDAFSTVELSPSFAVLFVVVTTMAIAGAWAVVQWVVDVTTGMQNLRNLRAVMWSLFAATGVGIGAGILFAVYFQRIDPRRFGFRDGGKRHESDETTAVESSEGWLSDRQQRRLVRALQVVLVGVLAFGVYRANIGIIVNTAVALALMELPAVLERDYRLPIDTGLTLWIVVPVFLHAVGTIGLYQSIGLWDQLTHTLSSSLVAAAGYTTVRALDIHADSVYLPKKFMVLFILLFTLAFGVLWELLEFSLDGLATILGTTSVLSQYSLENTMLDLVFDSVGGVIVAVWGATHLSNVSDAVAARLDTGTE
ncbi:hypothetical protein [Haladaptatus sp. CMAA 1911]|uniref:hypothetical protein n=1 Tax=unclassified Haladaptatus TaxID=2622732 RepID=UPI003754ED8F